MKKIHINFFLSISNFLSNFLIKLNKISRGEESDEDFMDDDEDEKPEIGIIENETRNKEIIQTIVELEDEQEKNKKTRQDLERQKSNIVSKKDIAASNLKNVIFIEN